MQCYACILACLYINIYLYICKHVALWLCVGVCDTLYRKSVMKQRLDPKKLDQLKEKINLAQFAVNQYGYKVDKKDSTPKWITLRNEADDKLLVHKNPNGHWSFSNLRDNTQKGSIYDLVKKEEPHLSFPQIVEKLTKYQPSVQPELDSAPSSKNVFDRDHLNNIYKANEKNMAYMIRERKIDPDILLNDPKFKDKVFIHKKDDYTNTAFPISNKGKSISGFIVKNSKWSGYMITSEHQDSLWVSNTDKNKPVEKIFVTESPIDAISHYQLNKEKLKDKNIVYMATGGSPTKGHHQLIDTFIKLRADSSKKDLVESIYDNDVAGRQFTSKMVGELKNIKKENAPVISTVGYSQKKDHPDIQANISFKQATKEQVVGFKNSFDNKAFEVVAAERNDGTKVVSVKFPKASKEHWDNLQKNLNQFNKNEVKSTFSQAKDFNQELKNKVGESGNSMSRKF